MSKTGRKNKNYSPEFKIHIIMDMRENHLGSREIGQKYKVAHSVILKWERIFLEEGAEGLMKERRGRACKASGTNKGRQPKLERKVEENLIAENQRLIMEIEY